MPKHCLSFLERHDPVLVELYGLADRLWQEDPSGAYTKLRSYAESVVFHVCAARSLKKPDNLYAGLVLLEENGLPPEVLEKLHRLREQGNRATHVGRGLAPPAPSRVVSALQDAHALGVWLHVEVLRQPASEILPFEAPAPSASLQVFRDAIMGFDPQPRYHVALALLHKAQAEYDKGIRESGIGLGFLFERAAEWFQKCRQLPAAWAQLGRLTLRGWGVDKNVEKAIDLLEAAADNGEPLGHSELGRLYLLGEYGCTKDIPRAIGHLEAAAAHDDPEALSLLVAVYADGLGAERNLERAFGYARKAAEAGHPLAQANLGLLYEQGLGVQVDLAQAFYWYQRAAKEEVPRGLLWLSHCYGAGKGVAEDQAERVRLLKRAAELHDPQALFELGTLHLRGESPSPYEALRCFSEILGQPTDEGSAFVASARSSYRASLQALRGLMDKARREGRDVPQDWILADMSVDDDGNPIPDFVKQFVNIVADRSKSVAEYSQDIERLNPSFRGRWGKKEAPNERPFPKVGRNEPCRCGSGRKRKRCHPD